MRVRRLLIVGLALAFSLVAVRLVVLEMDTRQAEQLDLLQSNIARISLDSGGLLVLSQDYLLNASPRAIRQWRAVHAELTLALAAAELQSNELKDDIKTLEEVAAELPALFDALLSASSEADRPQSQPRVDMLAGHLVAQTRRISDGAFDLAEKLADIRRARAAVERNVTRGTMVAFGMLLLLFAWVARRRLLLPLEGLEAVARSVQAGKFSARSGYRANDEFGDLSAAFDQMAQTLEVSFQRLFSSESSLTEAQRDLRNILDAVPSVIGRWDTSLRNRFANQAHEAWFGIGPGQMAGMHVRDVLHADFEACRPHMEAALRGEMQTFERVFRTLDGGSERNVLAQLLPDVVDGEVLGFYAICHDITQQTQDRTRLAAALRDNNALLSTIHRHSIVSVTDTTGRIMEANDNFCMISGYRREELLGHTHQRINSGHHAPAFWDRMWLDISAGRLWREEVCNRAKDGSLYWVDSVVAPFLGESGKVEKYISIRTDITSRKRGETLLQKVYERFEIAADSANIGVWEFDIATNTLVWDERMYRLYQREPTTDSEPYELWALNVHPDDRQYAEDVLAQALRGEREFDPEFRIVWPSGEVRHLKASSRVIRDVSGKPLRMTGVNIDITDRKRAELQLREAVEKSEQASLAKSQFLANMSHEIRTPMNAVVGLSHVLGRTALDADQSDCLAKIKLASKSLMAVINDVLDLSKIEAGELVLESRLFSMPDLLKDMVDVVRVQARAKGIAIAMDAPTDLPSAFLGDATRLRQILSNLLSNAIKFTSQGGVSLKIQRLPDVADQICIRFAVHDTGIGIAPEVQTRLFAPFAQADASTTRRFGGTGLGLSIVKRLSALMGGSHGLTSSPGAGSVFWVELGFVPASASDADAMLGVSAPSLGERSLLGVRVLVVDDSTINLDVARRILELEGAQVVLAMNGQLALDCLAATPQGFDIVLMDVQMPVLDGYEATRRIRTELGLVALPIIALTAGAMTSERSRAIDAGMDEFISKPFDAEALVRTVARLAAHHPADGDKQKQMPLVPAPTVQQADAWPDIEGIDTSDVSARLNNDVELFTSMLRRLLDEFSSEDTNLAIEDPGQLPAHAAHLHKLRGGAGMLGAKAIHQLAGAAEAACRAGQYREARRLTVELVASLAQLRTCAALVIGRAPPDVAGTDKGEAAAMLDPSAIEELTRLLRQQNFGAIERFRVMASGLKYRMGLQAFDILRSKVDAMRFTEAASLLDAARTTLQEGGAAGNRGVARAEPMPQAAAYQTSLLAGQSNAALACVTSAMDVGASLAQACVRIVQPALYEVGELWQKNRISVAQEHLASAISENVMVSAYLRASFAPSIGKSAVFACVEGNHHGLGLRMLSDAFETHGWNTAYLGTNVALRDLFREIELRRPDLLALSAALPRHLGTARDTITALRAELGSACPPIWIGGKATLSSEGAWRFTLADYWARDALHALEQL